MTQWAKLFVPDKPGDLMSLDSQDLCKTGKGDAHKVSVTFTCHINAHIIIMNKLILLQKKKMKLPDTTSEADMHCQLPLLC